jgi:hypothetical protein
MEGKKKKNRNPETHLFVQLKHLDLNPDLITNILCPVLKFKVELSLCNY